MIRVLLLGDLEHNTGWTEGEALSTGMVLEADPAALRRSASLLYAQVDLVSAGLLRLTVDELCSCGGCGPSDPQACPVCKLWHIVKPNLVESKP